MFEQRLAVLAILALPAIASGQRTRGEKRADFGEINRSSKSALRLSNKDVENMSPIKLLIAEKKALHLTDAQLKQLKDLDEQLKDRNKELFTRLDSLRIAMLPDVSDKDDDRTEMGTARLAVMNAVNNIRGNYGVAIKEVVPSLDEAQAKTAGALLIEQQDSSDKTLRDKMGGGGGGAPGGRPAGRRPPNGS